MTCYYPVTLYKSREGRDKLTGKWALGSIKNGFIDLKQNVSCGRCVGCRLERSRQWAIRCVHESQMHDNNCFATLTYKDEELVYGKKNSTLYPRHLELFWKRLRKEYGNGIRYFACGEYGDRTSRPHYHACIFGMDFEDKQLFSTKDGIELYSSDTLDSIWVHGSCTLGSVTFESAAYVARYIMDKKLGKDSVYYEEQGIEPEFIRMSRRPGLGSSWYDKYYKDVYPHDYVVVRGVKCKPPRFYDSKKDLDSPKEMRYIRESRVDNSYSTWEERTRERLIVREEVKKRQINVLRR